MPLVFLARAVTGLLSFVILGAAAYLLYTWWTDVEVVRTANGYVHDRDGWRLYTGVALLAFSLLGRLALLPLLASSDVERTKPERAEGRFIEGADGARLWVTEEGPAEAQPIVFTHGWGLDSTIWFYARHALRSRFRVITWDLPGLGRSKAGPDNGVSLDAFAANLTRVMDLAGGKRVVLAGHSIGGMTIQTLVRDRPELLARVSGVVLINTTHTNPLKTIVFSGLMQALRRPLIEPMMHLARWLQPLAWLGAWKSYLDGTGHAANRLGFGKYVTRSQLEQTTLLATRNPPGILARGNLAMFRWDATPALPNLTVPTLIIGGDKDIVTKLEASRTIAAAVPQARLEVVEDVNHMGFLERADLYNDAIARFTDGVAA